MVLAARMVWGGSSRLAAVDGPGFQDTSVRFCHGNLCHIIRRWVGRKALLLRAAIGQSHFFRWPPSGEE